MGTGRGPFLGTPKRTDTVWVAAAVVRYVADAGRAKVTSWGPAEGCIWGTPERTDIVWGARAGVRYVVDAGRAKAKRLEAGGALARYEVGWVSKAAAEQRAGRAGRMGPGHCYRRARGPLSFVQTRPATSR